MTTSVNKSAMATGINGEISRVTQSDNQSLDMVIELIKTQKPSDFTYLLNEKRDFDGQRMDDWLCSFRDHGDNKSPYEQLLEDLEYARDQKKNDKRKAEEHGRTVTDLSNKRRAVHAMAKRVIYAAFELMECDTDPKRLGTGKQGGNSVLKHWSALRNIDEPGTFEMDDEKNVIICQQRSTVSELSKAGKKSFDEFIGKTKKENVTTRNPAAGIVSSSKALNDTLDVAVQSQGIHAITDFGDDTEDQLRTTFATLFSLMFADDTGHVDLKDVKDYVTDFNKMAETNKIKAEPKH